MPLPSGSGVRMTILRFCLSTLPLFAVLVYLLYNAVDRAFEDPNDGPNDDLFSLMDTAAVFLSFHVVWTAFSMYLLIFVPKRRYLLERYLREGETTMGDVIVLEESSRGRGIRRFFQFPQYGYAIYSHPTKPKVVRKKIRVYQHFTRERVAVLRLPNKPLSGQAKVEIEIDLNQMRHERKTTLCAISAISVVWALFSLAGGAFCIYQMFAIGDDLLVGNENPQLARRVLFLVIGINPFFSFFANAIRYLMFYNWMVKWGFSSPDEGEARNVRASQPWYLHDKNEEAASFDGSDEIPYSIIGEDRSYAGTVPSHTRSLASARANGRETATTIPMTIVEGEGAAVPWANP